MERLLAQTFGADSSPVVCVQELSVVDLSYAESAAFMEANHLQGATAGTTCLGLLDDAGAVIAAMTVTKRDDEFTIDRYATACQVSGGFAKLVDELEQRISESGVGRMVAFADLAHSDGALYLAAGFTADTDLPPDYSYLHAGRRVNKSEFRKSRFRSDPELEWEAGLTESELADRNGLIRVWDAGKRRFVREVPGD